MKRAVLTGLVLLSAVLPWAARAGGHLVFVPNFVVIPGQKPTTDEVCVAETITVGAKSTSQNGDVLEVIALNGKSKMCREKDKPLLAHVQLTPASDFQSTLRIGLPDGFREAAVTDRDRFNGRRFAAENLKRHLYVSVSSWRTDKSATFNAWIRQQRSVQIDGNARTTSRVEELEIDGCEARRWDLIGEPGKGGLLVKNPQRVWVETYIKGDHELVWVEVGVNADDLDKARDEINAIAEGIQGLRDRPTDAAGTDTTASTHPTENPL